MDRARRGRRATWCASSKVPSRSQRSCGRSPATSRPAACCCRMRGCRASSLSAISGHGNRMTENPPLWKANVVLAKELAADVAAVLELSPPAPQAVLIVDELFKATATVEALYTEAPDAALLSHLTGHAVIVAPLPDQDWIKLSQEGLPPVRAGRFFVYGAHDAGQVPPRRSRCGSRRASRSERAITKRRRCVLARSAISPGGVPSSACWIWAAAPACSRSVLRSCGAKRSSPPTSIPWRSR